MRRNKSTHPTELVECLCLLQKGFLSILNLRFLIISGKEKENPRNIAFVKLDYFSCL
jgi:hypothetical protein